MSRQMVISDLEFAAKLRADGVLEDVDGRMLNLRRGVIALVCPDGDQMEDLFTHHAKLQREYRKWGRPHFFALNGGALRVPVGSPLNGGAGEVLLGDIRAARRMKRIRMVVLYVHTPCGVATDAHIELPAKLDLLMQAKARIKAECGRGVKVACFLHVDWSHGKRCKKRKQRTYFVASTKWRHYSERSRALAAQ